MRHRAPRPYFPPFRWRHPAGFSDIPLNAFPGFGFLLDAGHPLARHSPAGSLIHHAENDKNHFEEDSAKNCCEQEHHGPDQNRNEPEPKGSLKADEDE